MAEIINGTTGTTHYLSWTPDPGETSYNITEPLRFRMIFDGPGSLRENGPSGYLITFRIERSNSTASNDQQSNPSPPENTDSETETAQIDYDNFSNWAYFSNYPWVYNYDNKAWYYMQSTKDGLFAYNSNVSGNGWLNVGGVN